MEQPGKKPQENRTDFIRKFSQYHMHKHMSMDEWKLCWWFNKNLQISILLDNETKLELNSLFSTY